MGKKKIISLFIVGVLSLCNCFQTMAMEKQEAKVVSVESPRNSEVEQEIREITPNVPGEADLLNLKESEMIGSGHSFGEATWISVNNPVVDSLVEDDSNYYVFHIPKDGKINIDFSHEVFESATEHWKINLYDGNHNYIDGFSSTDGYTKSCRSWDYGLAAGTYYIEVFSYEYEYTGRTYSFKINYDQADNWETEFNNSWLTADKIQLNKVYYGSMPDESDDYYVFTLPKAGRINIDFSHGVFESATEHWKINLYDGNHNYIDGFSSTDGYTKSCKSWDYGLAAGTYYIEVFSYQYEHTGRTYSFKINYAQADNWETEFNNSWLTADKIQLNKVYYGSMPDESDDYYVFTLPKAGRINIDLSHEVFESATEHWKINLYDSKHNYIDGFTSTDGYKKSCKSREYGLAAGTYYLEVCSYQYQYIGRNYSLKVNTKPCLNETFQSGNAYYKVKKDGITGEVQFTGMVNKNKTSVTIPSTVSCHGFSYKVITVKSDAFKNNKKLKSVTLGNNITSLGSNVFYGCNNLKKITVKGTKLKKVGSGSLKGINKKAVIKVPKSKLTAYKKIFKGKGQAKSVKITK